MHIGLDGGVQLTDGAGAGHAVERGLVQRNARRGDRFGHLRAQRQCGRFELVQQLSQHVLAQLRATRLQMLEGARTLDGVQEQQRHGPHGLQQAVAGERQTASGSMRTSSGTEGHVKQTRIVAIQEGLRNTTTTETHSEIDRSIAVHAGALCCAAVLAFGVLTS